MRSEELSLTYLILIFLAITALSRNTVGQTSNYNLHLYLVHLSTSEKFPARDRTRNRTRRRILVVISLKVAIR